MEIDRSHGIGSSTVAIVSFLVVVGLTIPALGGGDTPQHVIPREPPRADRMDFGPLDELGQATITGSPGAVLPGGTVQVINLDTGHQAFVDGSEVGSDGSFETTIFAPPGSNIMVRHGPSSLELWDTVEIGGAKAGLTVFPSTTIHRPREHEASHPSRLAFASVGATGVNDAGTAQDPTSIDAGWSLTGTVGPAKNLRAGDEVVVDATLRLYSDGIDSSVHGQLTEVQPPFFEPRKWTMLFEPDGTPLAQVNQPGSSRVTPSGFPILDGRRPAVAVESFETEVGDWRFAGPHSMETDVTVRMQLDDDMPTGTYRPVLVVDIFDVPEHSDWRVASLLFHQGWDTLTHGPMGAALPLLEVRPSVGPSETPPESPPGDGADDDEEQDDDEVRRRLVWRLLMDTTSIGTRGVGAREDEGVFEPASFVATQGAPYVLPPVDPYTGEAVPYRMEPYLPMISYGRGAAPETPLVPFDLPGGELCVSIHRPDGVERDLGCALHAQSVSGDRSTRGGVPLNFGAIEVSEYYGLTTNDERFVVTFDQPGHHVIEMRGWVKDVWGTRYDGGGTYDIYVAHPLDIEPGTLPGTPLEVGDALNTAVRVQPHVPAEVTLTVEHYPFSDPALRKVHVREGRANRFGYFAPVDPPLRLGEPGEYRVSLAARYTDQSSGDMWMGAATWGGIVMTPPDDAILVAHGRRGMDNANLPFDGSEPRQPIDWFFLCDLGASPGSTPHAFNPYLNGDILWSRDDVDIADNPGCMGDALLLGASVEDTSADRKVESAITDRFERNQLSPHPPGSLQDRIDAAALPLFSSTESGLAPALVPDERDQIAYAYLSSQRPGVRVRETVSEDSQGSGYWRVDGMYDGQPGVGPEGDLPNDFKFQFVGAVYRDLETGLNQYVGQGTGWIHTDPADITEDNRGMMRSRVMPPFSGPGNGGWEACGGPLMMLQGHYIHQFVMPTAVRPGAVLEVGDRVDFAGHVMPTLNSRVEVDITGPSGQVQVVSGRANQVGYFHAPEDAFAVDEPGRWTAHVRVWHDGAIGNGQIVNCDPDNPFDPDRPCPSGGLLGSVDGYYDFYVVPQDSEPLAITTPTSGPLSFSGSVQPIEVSGPVPDGMEDASVDFTITMPGFILEQGQATVADGRWSFLFDPVALNHDFPNLDLKGLHDRNEPGLSDTFSLSVHLSGQQDGHMAHHAATFTIQGDLVQHG